MQHGRIRTVVATLPLLILTIAARPESAAQFEDIGLYRAQADGSGFEKIPVQGRNPAPSPDGTMLAFATGGPDGPAIAVVTWDGTGERRVTLTTGIPLAPAWSPDGRRLAFVQADQTYNLSL